MADLKKYNLTGEQIGSISVDDSFATAEVANQMVKDYIVALRANARQWSANTKTRAEVKHTTKKSRQQKGSGRARQGMLSTAQHRGGGIVFGPKPKFDQKVRINKKERRAAIRALLAEKIRNQSVVILENTNMDEPKTRKVAEFLDSVAINGRVLILVEANTAHVEINGESRPVSTCTQQHQNFLKSVRNLPWVEWKLMPQVNGYDLLLANHIVIAEAAMGQMIEWLGSK